MTEPLQSKPVRLSMMRKTISKRMSESWAVSPRVTYHTSLDVSGMVAFRDSFRKAGEDASVKVTYNHIIMKASAVALMEMPGINASITDKELLLHPSANVGLAVSVSGGLVVPNVKQCEQKSLKEIAAEMQMKIASVQAGKICLEDISGATFTVTNLGQYGVTAFSPIINQPELAILGVCAIVDTPVAAGGKLEIRPVMGLSLTADHRAVDGTEAAKFLARIRSLLENPAEHEAFA